LITFTGAGTVAPYTFTYEINGGAPQVITTSTGNSITIPVPTNTAGSYKYTLISVKDGNILPAPCFQLQSASVTVTVNAVPTANISGSTEVCVNAPAPLISFTGIGGLPPYTFSYNVNGGAAQTITSSGNTANITIATTIPGTFTYKLLSVTDAANTSCNQLQSGTATITVNPLPTGNFAFNAPLCVGSAIPFTDLSVPNAGGLSKWTWDFGDPGSGAANTSSLQNPTHLYANAGVYTVTLIVGNDKGCVGVTTQKTITISMLPKAGFVLPEVCLLDPFAIFTDTSSGAGHLQSQPGYGTLMNRQAG
jgi:PKD repeat protein